MRLLFDLRARADAAYANDYHSKLRGCLWKALDGTRFDEEHDSGDPHGFCFGNPFPWGDLEEGDQRKLLVSSVHDDLLAHVADHYDPGTEMNVGPMPFAVEGRTPLDVDVGEPGTSGTLETATGVFVRITPEHRERYGIDGDHGDTVTYWRPEHGYEPFREAVEANLQHKHDVLAPDYLRGPAEVEGQLFDGLELIKTYSLPLEVTTGVERTVVLSKWKFDYTVRDDDHRRHLNLALDAGLGGRSGYGLGFLNRVDDAV